MVRMILALLLLTGSAHADTMYRCVSKAGAVSYQDYPCGKAAKQTASAYYTPEVVPRYRPPVRRLQRAAQGGSSTTGAHLPIEPQSVACEVAKTQRTRTLEAVGLRRTYELLQRLDDQVRQACK